MRIKKLNYSKNEMKILAIKIIFTLACVKSKHIHSLGIFTILIFYSYFYSVKNSVKIFQQWKQYMYLNLSFFFSIHFWFSFSFFFVFLFHLKFSYWIANKLLIFIILHFYVWKFVFNLFSREEKWDLMISIRLFNYYFKHYCSPWR